jgi:hypothetical protein
MDDHSDSTIKDDWLRDLPLRSEEIGFSADQMVACVKCGKANGPNRAACLYCGVDLVGVSVEKKRDVRQLESWESGSNLVVTNARAADIDGASVSLASLLGIEPACIKAILRSRTPVPIARVESDDVASYLAEKLAAFQIETRIVSDLSLSVSSPPVRLRAVTFEEDELLLHLFNQSEVIRLRRDDLVLIVAGVVFEGRTEAVEKRKRGTTKTISETQTSSDVPVIDIYSRHDPQGWRVTSHGFDFSCLGAGKSLLVVENLESLVAKLIEIAPHAKLVDDYVNDRPLLEHCWPSESRKDVFGFQRSGFARKDLSSVFTTSNAVQLTRYSRMHWHLL